jgi:hypothetical protein
MHVNPKHKKYIVFYIILFLTSNCQRLNDCLVEITLLRLANFFSIAATSFRVTTSDVILVDSTQSPAMLTATISLISKHSSISAIGVVQSDIRSSSHIIFKELLFSSFFK